jgi:5-methylcytosine-specific restriction endonuclease McrA
MSYSKIKKVRISKYDKNGSLGKKPRSGQYKHCEVCKVEYYVKPFNASKSKYCSYDCKHKGQMNRVGKICATCKKGFSRPVSAFKWASIRGHKNTYCSRYCESKDRRTDWENDPRKNSKEYYNNIRWSIQFKEWRKAVFERDDYTCQRCGLRGGKLEPHHIFRFAYFPEFRFSVANGMVLCFDCHQLTKKYDKRFKLVLI